MIPCVVAPGWSDWRILEGMPVLTGRVLAKMLDGGQAFRWRLLEPNPGIRPTAGAPEGNGAACVWEGIWADNIARLQLDPDGHLQWSAPVEIREQVGADLARYLGLGWDFAMVADSLPWRSDPHLACCLSAFPGLRILRQPFGETLLCFLCSATKRIVQIKQMVALLARRHGAPLLRPPSGRTDAVPGLGAAGGPHRLPRWDELANVSEHSLRECLLGFRARHVAQTARFLAGRPEWLDETEALPYPEARERLLMLPGVGEKIADCVLLYGAGRLESFPVDVWILKAMARHYGLEGWTPAQLTRFGRVHFGPFAGFAQQVLFEWERESPEKRAAVRPRVRASLTSPAGSARSRSPRGRR